MTALALGLHEADAVSYAEAGLSRVFEAMRLADADEDDAVNVSP